MDKDTKEIRNQEEKVYEEKRGAVTCPHGGSDSQHGPASGRNCSRGRSRTNRRCAGDSGWRGGSGGYRGGASGRTE